MRLRGRVTVLGCVLVAVSLLATALVALIVVAAVPDRLALVLSVIAASVPALVYAAIVLRLDRYEIEPVRALVACFAWGAIGAVLLSLAGGLLFQIGVEHLFGYPTAAVASVVLGAPLVEETAKGIAVLGVLRLARHELDDTLDGLVYGALVGVGFAMTENILYFGQSYLQGGIGDLGELFVARAVLGGFGHPAYTAVTGAAIGWARGRYGRGFARVAVPFLGWVVAVALHEAWNGGLVYAQFSRDDEVSLLQAVAVQAAVVIVPAVLVLYAVARLSARHELQILRDQLRDEVANGVLTTTEYETIIDGAARQRALAAARERGGRSLRARQQAFFHTAAELAFRGHHRGRGETLTARQLAADEVDRQRLIALREQIAGNVSALEAQSPS
jgi:RsiW-degrading membrane proteinase PrsW (M82 family)